MARVDQPFQKPRLSPVRLALVIVFLLSTTGITAWMSLDYMKMLYWGGEHACRLPHRGAAPDCHQHLFVQRRRCGIKCGPQHQSTHTAPVPQSTLGCGPWCLSRTCCAKGKTFQVQLHAPHAALHYCTCAHAHVVPCGAVTACQPTGLLQTARRRFETWFSRRGGLQTCRDLQQTCPAVVELQQ